MLITYLLILDTMAMTGLRRGEIVNLKVGDLYFNDGKSLLMVKNGKGAKDRCIPLNPTIATRLQEYIINRDLSGKVFPVSATANTASAGASGPPASPVYTLGRRFPRTCGRLRRCGETWYAQPILGERA